ncbi:MAG: hypothetical protein IJY09_06360 [Lachnospiraceae bacterium]|nr:hypothetical protein [Lachnospiraceae bacterium]
METLRIVCCSITSFLIVADVLLYMCDRKRKKQQREEQQKEDASNGWITK